MHLRLRKKTGPYNLLKIAELYKSFTFHGFTWGDYGFGLIHFSRNTEKRPMLAFKTETMDMVVSKLFAPRQETK